MHHHQYMSPLNGSSSSSTTGSPTGTTVTTNMPLIASIANVKDSRWLTLEVCREYQRGKCSRSEQECKFAHPPTHVEVNSGKVIACFDSLKGKCNRTNPPCKYLHPPQHLRDILLQNGRNNLILRSIAMNLAANQPMYPQTATHMPYPNGAILSNPLQAATSLASYSTLAPTATGQPTFLINQAGQTFTIPMQSLQAATTGTAMYTPDVTSYFSPVTQLPTTSTGLKTTRTDRLEVYPNNNNNNNNSIEYDPHKQQQTATDDEGAYTNGYVSAYQQYPGQIQTIYTRAPSVDIKDTSLVSPNNISNGDLNSSSNNNTAEIKPHGTQYLTAQQCVQSPTAANSMTNNIHQHQKRSAIADPNTGIPMPAYQVAAFPYGSPSPLQIPFQGPYFTTVPMTFTGYAPHLPRL